MTVKFNVLGEPRGKGRPRVVRNKYTGKSQTFTDDATANYENLIKVEYRRQTKGFRFEDTDMIDMRIYAYFAIPKSASKKKKTMMIEQKLRPTKKPDMDNVLKVFADALNGIAYRDDTQIVDTIVRKFYSEEPRVEVVIKKIEGVF